MMVDWALGGLITRLPLNDAAVHFIIGDKDGTVPPEVSINAANRMQNTTVEHFGLGHLAHEEAPAEMAEAVMNVLK